MSAPRRQGWVGPIEWMARNSIAANLLMILLLGGGLWMAVQVQKEIFPEAQLDVVEVEVTYPGAAPEEVEQGVLMPVEEAVQGVESIEEMVSTAREGSGVIQLELVAGANRMQALQDIEQAVDRVRTFPDQAEEPRDPEDPDGGHHRAELDGGDLAEQHPGVRGQDAEDVEHVPVL